MNLAIPDQTVGQMVAEHPEYARLFEKLGIDYCCGDKRSFNEVCAARNLDSQTVVRMLETELLVPKRQEERFDKAGLRELCDHIEATHHAYLKTELPRLSEIAAKVARVHGEEDPSLREVARIFEEFRAELTNHMVKEEMILFPHCRKLDSADACPDFHCVTVRNPIAVMELEHAHAGDALDQMRRLTHDFTPPDWACNTYRILLQSLHDLEIDMHKHVHKENSILFPKSVAREEELRLKYQK